MRAFITLSGPGCGIGGYSGTVSGACACLAVFLSGYSRHRLPKSKERGDRGAERSEQATVSQCLQHIPSPSPATELFLSANFSVTRFNASTEYGVP